MTTLTETDSDLITTIVTAAAAQTGATGQILQRAVDQLYAAFHLRGAAILTAAAHYADTLWTRLRPAPLTDAELDRCLKLKRKGFGNWDRDDIAFLATIEDSHPHVPDLLYPTPIGTEPPRHP